jgi:hypothetical protein
VSLAILAAAYLAVIVNYAWIVSTKRRGDVPLPGPFRYASVLLVFCVLAYAGDVLVLSSPRCPALVSLSVLAAVAASVAALALPRNVRALVGDWSAEAWKSAARADAAAERELTAWYERIRARLGALENHIRRSAWLERSRDAVRQLDEMLFELDSLRGHRDADVPSGAARQDAS